MATDNFDLIKAPSKFDLMISLMQGDSSNRVPVVFRLKDNDAEIEIHVVATMLMREDGSGDNWLFEGYVDRLGSCVRIGSSPRLEQFILDLRGVHVHGYYNIVRRTGWINEGSFKRS